jgi:putative oxidoreductase
MRSLGLLVLRLVVGGLFVVHGYPKFFGGAGKGEALDDSTKSMLGAGFVQQMEYGGMESVTGFMGSLQIANPAAAAWALSLAEFAGGMALILGFKTRPAAAALAFSQLVAINKVEADKGLVGGYEFNVSLIGATTALALAGPGKISIDRK